MARIDIFWWAFGIRGGFAVLFAGLLAFSGNLLGSLIFDPVMLIMLSLLLGFYVFAIAVLFGVAAAFSFEKRLGIGWLLTAESSFAFLLGMYISFSLLMTSQSIALLAGIHAAGAGCFQAFLALSLIRNQRFRTLLGVSALIAIGAGILFLTHLKEQPRLIALWMSGFELIYGVIVIAFARALHQETLQTKTEMDAH